MARTVVAVVGVGAVGGVVASALSARADLTVRLCSRRGFDELIVESASGVSRTAAAVELDPQRAPSRARRTKRRHRSPSGATWHRCAGLHGARDTAGVAPLALHRGCRALRRAPASTPALSTAMPSIPGDPRAGRALEHDARNAVIPRRPARHGIAAPVCSRRGRCSASAAAPHEVRSEEHSDATPSRR